MLWPEYWASSGLRGERTAGNLSLRRPCVCPDHRCKRHHSGQVKERQIGREMCPVWLHLSSGCVFLCVGVWLWLRMFTWVMLDMWDEVCMCLQFKYWLNCQKCSDLGCCLSIRTSLTINKYFRATVGSVKPGRLTQMHAAFFHKKTSIIHSCRWSRIESFLHSFPSNILSFFIISLNNLRKSSIIVVFCDVCSIGRSSLHSAAHGSVTIWVSERLQIRFVLIDHETVFFTAWKLKWSAQGY